MTELFSLAGKTAFVTGASSGLGAHFAQMLAKAGAEVILGARREEALAKVADTVRAAGGTCTTASLDVTSAASIAAITPLLARSDILINNAGIAIDKPFLKQSEDDWDAVVDTNLKGMFLMTQAFAAAAKERGKGGSVINIASIVGIRPAGAIAPYAASKAGAIHLTKNSALELAKFGVRVNAICPGYFSTEMNGDFWDTEPGQALLKRVPFRRLGEPKELDGAVLLLASDAGSFMTGSVIAVDGGHLVGGL